MESIEDVLNDPPRRARPLARWWWPGLDVDAGELEREVADLDDAGFGGVEIQAFLIGSPSPNPDKKHRFAPNRYYYEMLRVVLEAARARDMIVDLTISSSWPPGASWVKEEDSLKTLLMGTSVVRGPGTVQARIPPFKLNPYYKHQKLMRSFIGSIFTPFDPAAYAPLATITVKPIKKSTRIHFLRPNATPLDVSTVRDVSARVDANSMIELDDLPDADTQLFTIYHGPSGMTPMSDAKPDPAAKSRVVDMFNEGAVERFVNGHLDPGDDLLREFYGSTLRALFTDSQEIASEWFWTDDFFEEFEKRRGYDVRPYLPACFVPNRDNQFLHVIFQNETPCFDFPGGDGERIRHDWEETLSDLFAERYCGGVSKLARERGGMLHRIQTYGIRVDLLKAYGRADIPETEMLFAGGAMDFLKIASSAALVYQKPVVAAESFVFMGRDYMTTPLKIKASVDRLIVAGINQVIYHGFPYNAPWKNYPGHYPWSPPCFSDNFNKHNPFWPYFPAINAYITRLQAIMRQGTTRCNVGVYYGLWNYDYKHLHQEEMMGGYLPGFDAPREGGIIHRFMRRVKSRVDKRTLRCQVLGESLMSRGYTYTHVNEEVLINAKVEGGKLVAGHAALEAIVLSDCDALSVDLAYKLVAVASMGVKVIFLGSLPTGQPGFLHRKERDMIVVDMVSTAVKEGTFTLLNDGEDPGYHVWHDTGILPVVEFLKAEPDIQCICKDTAQGSMYFIRSASCRDVSVDVGFHEKAPPVLVDPWTGQCRPAPRYRGALKEGSTALKYAMNRQTVHLSFPPYGSTVVWFPAGDAPHPRHVAEANCDIEVDGTTVTALVDTDMIVTATLGDGTRLSETVLLPPPRTIALDSWRLEVDHRNPDGTRRAIEIDGIAPGDWRKVKELRHCSGPATYTTTAFLTREHVAPGVRMYLDLGIVHDVATITVNETMLDPVLVPAYKVDVTSLVHEGENRIEVRVTTTLRNLLAGYGKQVGKPWKHHAKRTLMPAGMLGPARLVARLAVPVSRGIGTKP